VVGRSPSLEGRSKGGSVETDNDRSVAVLPLCRSLSADQPRPLL